jgi:hypothetical protein
VGTMPHAQIMHSIELLGNVVAPAVRKALGVSHPASKAARVDSSDPEQPTEIASAQAR